MAWNASPKTLSEIGCDVRDLIFTGDLPLTSRRVVLQIKWTLVKAEHRERGERERERDMGH
jgi:hypothetical protein